MPEPNQLHKQSANGKAPGGWRNIATSKQQRTQRPFLDWILRNQILLALTVILGVACLHSIAPPLRPHTRKLFTLSYPSPKGQGIYTQGVDDIYFVLAWVINFTALRAIVIEWVLRPLAGMLNVAPKSHLRFAEQGWLFLYYSTFWALGMHLWYNSVYWLNNAEIWTAWPSREMSGLFKWYYLVQLSFCTQQLLAIHMEARRKDYIEMLTHHVITCSLISITYVYRYTRAANVVLCLMDLVDILLPFAKLLRYLRCEAACNFAFGIFVVTWFITRHVMYLNLCWDIYKDVPGPTTMLFGCYNGATSKRLLDMPAQPDYFSHLFWPFQDLDGVICLNTEVKYIFLGMLIFLHTLSSIWFVMILKVIAGILLGKPAEDIRSDDECEEQQEFNIETLNPCTGSGIELSDEVLGTSTMASRFSSGIEDLNPCTGAGTEVSDEMVGMTLMARTNSKPRPTTVRRRLMDTESRKELLARIGCEKPI